MSKITLIHGDCLEVLPTLGPVDLVLTDPPYGIGRDGGMGGGGRGFGGKRNADKYKSKYIGNWDNKRPNKKTLHLCVEAGKRTIIWGGNYFADILPQSFHWLVWDKLNAMPSFSDCELAWTNSQRKSVKKFTKAWGGLASTRIDKVHPTQKPVKLMEWCITQYGKNANTILDPFMGSGTTGVACVNLDRDFIGIEIDETYFNIAKERIEQAQRDKAERETQVEIFEPEPQLKQAKLSLDTPKADG